MNPKDYIKTHFPALYQTAREIHFKLLYSPNKVISIDESLFHATELMKQLPRNYDCIIGIPRSGLFYANLFAMEWGLPLSTTQNFINGEVWQSRNNPHGKIKRVLLVEDSSSGRTINKHKEEIQKAFPSLEIETAAIYARTRNAVDYSGAKITPNPIFEYSLTFGNRGTLCTDLDGVLCHNEDHFKPYIIPKYEIQAVITSRPESDRTFTETWLKLNGVKYRELIMRQNPHESSVHFKARILRKLRPAWYWESEDDLAAAIAKKSGIPVLSIQCMRVHKPLWW